jgi:endonuclease YncB( thermonuclease family)
MERIITLHPFFGEILAAPAERQAVRILEQIHSGEPMQPKNPPRISVSRWRKAVTAIHFFLFLILAPFIASGESFQARVVAVTDGDSLTIEPVRGGASVRIRLYGIASPAMNQPYGEAARSLLIDAAMLQVVTITETSQGRDALGRHVVIAAIPEVGVLQELLLEAGLAWVYPLYCPDCANWYAIQQAARAEKRGLWADDDPLEPWEWRKKQAGKK